MTRDNKTLCVRRRILLTFSMIAVLVSGMSAYALAPLQAGQGPQSPGRNDNSEAQRAQQYDQQLQLQQQQQALRDMDVAQRSQDLADLSNLQYKIWQLYFEREKMKAELRENFRQHYAIIRKNAENLVQLTSSIESDLDNNNQAFTREDIDKTARMQKFAREILDNMAGRKLPKEKPARATVSSTGMAGIGIADHERVLREKTSDAKAAASTLKKAVDDYLASDNEQAVSVSALKTTSKEHFDPNSVAIIKACVRLQQLSDEIRSEMRMVNALR